MVGFGHRGREAVSEVRVGALGFEQPLADLAEIECGRARGEGPSEGDVVEGDALVLQDLGEGRQRGRLAGVVGWFSRLVA